MNKKLIIAIDGPAAAGKTTIAKALASKLNIPYISTGALYRALALKCLQNGLDASSEDVAMQIANTTTVSTTYQNGRQIIWLDGADVTDKLYTDSVSDASSKISTHKVIREHILEAQRKIAQNQSVVMDGRDIGSIVLPMANYKFYLDADVGVRAQRRYLELVAKGENVSYQEVLDDLKERDFRDKTRNISPLVVCKDAIVIDCTNLSISQVVDKFLEYIGDKKWYIGLVCFGCGFFIHCFFQHE